MSWFKNAAFYQVYPLSFKDSNGDGYGDLAGVIEKLPYIKSLGVDAIWLNPFYKSPMKDFGYDISDYTEVDPIFGYMFDFERLVSEAHALGLKVVIDLVLNHTSSEHPWFLESRSSKDNPKRDWYIWKSSVEGDNQNPPSNWLSVFGGSAWTLDEKTGEWYLHTFLEDQPDLNWRNEEVKKEMYKVLDFWLSKGVDGFRGDAVHHLFEDGEFQSEEVNSYFKPGFDNPYTSLAHSHTEGLPETIKAIFEISEYIKKYGEIFFITEAYLDLKGLLHVYKNCPIENHSPFNFNFMSLPWEAQSYKEFVDTYLSDSANFPKNYVLGNHDRHRLISRVGREKALSLALLSLTLPGAPFIYYGEEIGMTDLEIEESKMKDDWGKRVPGINLGRDGERGVMQWDDSEFAGFSSRASWIGAPQNQREVNVEVEEKDPNSILNFYKKLLEIRKQDLFREGEYVAMPVSDGKVFGFKRVLGGKEALVLVNMSEEAAQVGGVVQGGSEKGSVFSSYLDKPLLDSPLRPNEARLILN